MKKMKLSLFLLAIPLIALLGYAIMRLVIYTVPMSHGNGVSYLFITIVIIAFGLMAPYWMLKIGFKGAQVTDPKQKPLALEDLPKEQHKAARR